MTLLTSDFKKPKITKSKTAFDIAFDFHKPQFDELINRINEEAKKGCLRLEITEDEYFNMDATIIHYLKKEGFQTYFRENETKKCLYFISWEIQQI